MGKGLSLLFCSLMILRWQILTQNAREVTAVVQSLFQVSPVANTDAHKSPLLSL